MRKLLPYMVGAVALIALVALVLSGPMQRSRKLDERITLRQKDKIPYGTFAAKNLLTGLFPGAEIITDKRAPNYWMDVTDDAPREAVFLMARSFDPEEYELKRLAGFVRKGNYVFIVAKSLSYEAAKFFKVTANERFFYLAATDSLEVRLTEPLFATSSSFIYPGKKFDSYFSSIDTTRAVRLGTDYIGHTNFVQLQAGAGKLFIHLAPLAFSNYFILHKNNVGYFQKAVSVLPPTIRKVVWNEYYLTPRKTNNEEEPGILRVLWQYPAFRWALVTALATLLLYVLLEMRRRQRLIPAWSRPANDSLDFVRTMGRLYYEKGDHKNLSKKMAAYFLDHVRLRYKLPTQQLDKAFVQELQAKSGYPAHELQRIVSFIQHLNDAAPVSEYQLSDFYGQLESFYQNT